MTITSCVPQGSVLGSTLWSMSSSTIIVFSDDVAVLATGHTTIRLEKAMNPSLDLLVSWIERRDLTLLVGKTEATMLITKFFLEGALFLRKKHVCNLGVDLCS